MSRWNRFFRNTQQDIKLFLFTLGTLCLFRLVYILSLHEYIKPNTPTLDFLSSFFWGLRISVKSAGIIAALTFFSCTVPNIFFVSRKLDKLRFALGCLYTFFLTTLFHASIPYYQAFNAGFNYMVYNAFRDDTPALLLTLIQDYHLFRYLLLIALVTAVLYRILAALLRTGTLPSPYFRNRYYTISFRVIIISLIPIAMIFGRFGGSMSYANSVHWENAAIVKDNLLNESILDSVQAMTRAYAMHKRIQNATKLDVHPERIAEYAAQFSHSQIKSDKVEDYLKKQANGPLISKPKHIVLIVGESLAEWPLLDKYRGLQLATGLHTIIEKENAILVSSFLPAAAGTTQAINALVTGLPEIDAAPNYHPESYRSTYATSIAPQMKKLGYKTSFWYGGFSSWQRIQDFILAQGFDTFHSSSDFIGKTGNAWGTDDKYLLAAVAESLKNQKDEYTFTVILTTSNHPPYSVALQQEGFDPTVIRNNLPPKYRDDDKLVNMLGHYWYSDKVITEFITSVRSNQPDSLFLITGDHAARVNIDPSPSLFERNAIPLIVYGEGVNKKIFGNKPAGDHLTIAPTLFELISPSGFTYYSYANSLTKGNSYGISNEFIITSAEIQANQSKAVELINSASSNAPEFIKIDDEINAMQALAWWRIQKGTIIPRK